MMENQKLQWIDSSCIFKLYPSKFFISCTGDKKTFIQDFGGPINRG